MKKHRRLLRIGAVGLLVALLFAAPMAAGLRPRTVPEMLRAEAPDWTGVLSLGVVPTFLTKGSLPAYAGAVARRYERANPGILISISELNPATLDMAIAAGTAPDVLLFGSGALEGAQALMPLDGGGDRVREELLRAATWEGELAALPVALGGYVLLAHEDAYRACGADEAQSWDQRLALMGAGSLQCALPGYTFPLAALIGLTDEAVLVRPDALPANAGALRRELAWPDFALEKKSLSYVGGPYEIGRMGALEAGGRIGRWEALPFGEAAYSDMALFCGVVRPEYTGRQDYAGRMAAAGTLLASFLDEENHGALKNTGLIPSTAGAPLYETVAGYEMMEASLSGELVVPNAFSQRRQIAQAQSGLDGAARYLRALYSNAAPR